MLSGVSGVNRDMLINLIGNYFTIVAKNLQECKKHLVKWAEIQMEDLIFP